MFPLRRFNFNVPPLRFCKVYECYPVTILTGNERENVERGGKIIMPSSALEELTLLNISYPMMFRLTNEESGRTSHCGVLEFVAEEGRVYLPSWMMTNLALNEGDEVSVESAELPIATYTKFQPQSVDFLDISDSKAVLENTLRDFACLTTGDCIAIPYNRKVYEVRVLETRPNDAVCIIECDMSVEFAAPVGYVAPVSDHGEECLEPGREFVPFSGQGNVLVNKKRKRKTSSDTKSLESPMKPLQASTCIPRGLPDYGYTVGGLAFFRSKLLGENKTEVSKGSAPYTEPFSGPGYTLKPTNQTNL